jgi:hypothetical protein
MGLLLSPRDRDLQTVDERTPLELGDRRREAQKDMEEFSVFATADAAGGGNPSAAAGAAAAAVAAAAAAAAVRRRGDAGTGSDVNGWSEAGDTSGVVITQSAMAEV